MSRAEEVFRAYYGHSQEAAIEAVFQAGRVQGIEEVTGKPEGPVAEEEIFEDLTSGFTEPGTNPVAEDPAPIAEPAQ